MKTTLTALSLMAALSLGMSPALAAGEQQAGADRSIEATAGMNPEKLQGKSVQTQDGETIGEIQSIVMDDSNHEIHAVISADEFLGTSGGDGEVAVSLGDLQMEGDNIVLMSQDAKTQLRNNKYDPQKYSDIDEDFSDTDNEPSYGDTPRQDGSSDVGAEPGGAVQ